ncbi:tetratricopeptide repeat protein [Candidatus Saccharibacteria bacterium]|nr:tetratricopeptide repeat protein [Candidatus Saccharibacteria bacterium]MBR3323814.1 tetratricopeptide repeat protein [Candidatus Saccharibacteria bacterium]
MLGILLILILCTYLCFFYPIIKPKEEIPDKNSKYAQQMKKLWNVAQDSMRERKPLRAEKALLTILKFDEKNAAAYNRLGILYAKEQKYDEAIECFEIAQSLDNNASSLHNAGLIYLETGAYEKAEIAFQQAIAMEGDVPARFIALAKSQEKLGKRKDAVESLENAYSISPTTSTLRQILAIYEDAGDTEAVTATTARIETQLAAEAKAREEKKATTSRRTRTTRRATRVARRTARSATATTTRAPHSSVRTARSTTARRIARPRPVASKSPAKPVAKPARSRRKLIQ